MKRLILVLILLLSSWQGASTRSFKLKVSHYYSLLSDVETRVTSWDGENLSLKISDIEHIDRVHYELGTELYGRVIRNKKAKRFYRDQYLMVQIDKVKFPDGTLEAEDLKIKIHPRPFLFNKERISTSLVDVVAFTLGTITSVSTV